VFDKQWVHVRLSRVDNTTLFVWPVQPNGPEINTASLVTRAARGILTADNLFTWREPAVTHAGFVDLTGVDGIRLRLTPDTIRVHHETIALPEHFAFVYRDIEAAWQQDLDMRRAVVGRWLRSNAYLRIIYPAKFLIDWYM
jgi:hypothetical protein